MFSSALEEFLKKNRVLSLSTLSSQGPHATPLYYAFESVSFSFFCISQPQSRHVQEVNENSNVALSISSAIHLGEELEGVQVWGKAFVRTKEDSRVNYYFTQFPEIKTHLLVKKETLFLQIQIEKIRWIQTYLGLPRKTEWKIEEGICLKI